MKRITYGWIVYRLRAGRLELMGIYPSKDVAQKDATLLNDDWQIASTPFLGWGEVEAGIFTTNAELTAPTDRLLH
jgi:hypothetical protein